MFPSLGNFQLEFQQYDHPRNLCIIVHKNNEPWGKLSVNVPGAELFSNQFFAKTYSKNEGWSTELLNFRIRNHQIFTLDHITVVTRYSEFPLYRITPFGIRYLIDQTYDKNDIFQCDSVLLKLYEEFCCDNNLI